MKSEGQIEAQIELALNKMDEPERDNEDKRRLMLIRDTLGWVLDEVDYPPISADD